MRWVPMCTTFGDDKEGMRIITEFFINHIFEIENCKIINNLRDESRNYKYNNFIVDKFYTYISELKSDQNNSKMSWLRSLINSSTVKVSELKSDQNNSKMSWLRSLINSKYTNSSTVKFSELKSYKDNSKISRLRSLINNQHKNSSTVKVSELKSDNDNSKISWLRSIVNIKIVVS